MKMEDLKVTKDSVLVLSKADCPYCEKTKEAFKGKGVNFEEVRIDLPENKELLEQLKKIGFKSAPIIFAKGEVWSGWNEEKVAAVS